MTRLFVGIRLPDAYQERVRPLARELAGRVSVRVNWTRPGAWHLTLKFLGETEDARIPAIVRALDAIRHPPFTVRAGGAGAFPNPRSPRVLWLGLEQGAAHCTDLARAVNDALGALDIPREKKRFRPHLTLGRVKKPGTEDWQGVLDRAANEKWPAFTADRFTLWQSRLAPTGAVHTPVKEFLLQGTPPFAPSFDSRRP